MTCGSVPWRLATLLRRIWNDFAVASIEFGFQVGTSEIHQVNFYLNQTWGSLLITVDDQVVLQRSEMFSLSTTKNYEFSVGNVERQQVRIQKVRPWVLAAFRKSTITVFVDDIQLLEY
jgi:hypothetical protein